MMHFIFDTLWGWLSITAIIVIACGVVAWLFPPFRRIAIMIGVGALSAATIYTKGTRDAARRKQAEWDASERKSIDRGNTARSDAERDVAAGRVRDKFDRDDK